MIKKAAKKNSFIRNAELALLAVAVFGVALPVTAQDATAPPIAVEEQPAAVPPAPQETTGAPVQPPAEAPPQETAGAPEQPPGAEGATKAAATISGGKPGLKPEEIGPLLYTAWERAAINDARKARKNNVPVNLPPQLQQPEELKMPGEEKPKPPPEEREITLGGILYVSSDDWTIWLNGRRITPKTIPLEARGLKVYEGYVELRWFDDYSNKIFPLRLRPHQRFNIDTRVFLPG